jgi:Tfp pilus assembly protein PilF
MARGLGPADPARIRDALAAGREALESGDAASAVSHLEEAFRRGTGNPEVMSWYGLSLVLAGCDRLRGVALCEAALRSSGAAPPADLLCNLGRAYLGVGYRAQAADALRRGAAIDPDHPGIHEALMEMGIRRPPIFTFLKRSNPINKYLGLLRHRLFPPNPEAPP